MLRSPAPRTVEPLVVAPITVMLDPPSDPVTEHPIILFDGMCNVCAASVQFIIRHDPHSRFRLAALQSDIGRSLCAAHGIDAATDSVVLIADGQAWDASDAALRIVRALRWPWPLAFALIAVPRPIRDAAYRAFARRRYRWFGRRAECLVPTAAIKARFLD